MKDGAVADATKQLSATLREIKPSKNGKTTTQICGEAAPKKLCVLRDFASLRLIMRV